MGQILKIAAGVLIALLAYQIISLKMMESSNQSSADHAMKVYRLQQQAIVVMNGVTEHYRREGSLPSTVSQIRCSVNHNCIQGQSGGFFYLKEADSWMAMQPYIDPATNKPRFHCRTTDRMNFAQAVDDRFAHCLAMEISDVPKAIRNF